MKRRRFLGLAVTSLTWPACRLVSAAALPVRQDTAAAKLAVAIRGNLFLPGSAPYELKRHGFAADVDLHPAMVVQVASARDVSTTVQFARDQKLPLAVRCGGHSYAGYNSCEGGVVIDLSRLRTLQPAPDGRTIRVGGGALSGNVEQATARIGRATTLGQCPGVGVGGFLLGGGVGPLMSRHGLGCDNVLAAEVVLADGRIVTASASEHPDLFWAIRGGGGNFGVVTAFTLKLHDITTVLGGYLTYRSSKAAELLVVLRDLAAAAPDSQSLIATLMPGRDKGFELSVQLCDVGDAEAAQRTLAALRKSPLLVSDTVVVQPYLALEQQVPFQIPPMRREYRGGFLPALSGAVIASLAEAVANAPDRNGEISLIFMHGAVTAVAADATAFPLRRRGFAHGVAANQSTGPGTDRAAAWVRTTARALAPFGDGAYVNVMGREDTAAVRAAYAGNYARLAALKAKYDPANLFNVNQNITPGGRS
ncbi:MAG: FAD-binding oxidoreductase [Rhodanobacter sp.]